MYTQFWMTPDTCLWEWAAPRKHQGLQVHAWWRCKDVQTAGRLIVTFLCWHEQPPLHLVSSVFRCMKECLASFPISVKDLSMQSHAYFHLGFWSAFLIALSHHMQQCGMPFQMAHTNALSYFTHSLHAKHLWDHIHHQLASYIHLTGRILQRFIQFSLITFACLGILSS